MLIPVYTIVALINILAKSQNFNFQPPKNLPYEIRFRRDLINALKKAENIADIKKEKTVNVLQVYDNLKEGVPKKSVTNVDISNENINYMKKFHTWIADVESERKYDNTVPMAYYLKINHDKLTQDSKRNTENSLNNQRRENVSLRENNVKNKGTVKYTIDNHNLVPEEIDAENHVNKSFNKSKLVKLLKDQRTKECKSLTDCSKREINKPHILNVTLTDKRWKRNFGSNGNNEKNGYDYNYNRSINNDPADSNLYNYHVTQKSTLNTAFQWVKNLVNTHEKYVITNDSAPYSANNIYNESSTGYIKKNITIMPNYNWNYGNNNNTYHSSGTQNFYTATPSYTGNTGYNYNQQQYRYNGFNYYQNNNNNNAVQNVTTPAYVTPAYYGVRGYNYSNQEYPNYGYSNRTNANIYNGLYPNSNSGYNNTVYYDTDINNGYNPFPVYNVTDTNDTTTEESIVIEGCILCGSFGCPKYTKRMGFRCIPIKRP